MNKFDTAVQELKCKVLTEVIKKLDKGEMDSGYRDIIMKISPGPGPAFSCCVHKDRAIIEARLDLALGGDKSNPNSVEVINVACEECPAEGVTVTEACRGCLVHRCAEVCPRGAISIVNQKSYIDKSKCIECGKCLEVCPYSAIVKYERPCIKACKVGAISIDEYKKAKIDNEKCISCGACVYKCPFGAISDKSYITEAYNILKESEKNKKYKVYAIVAPSIAGQFEGATTEQVVTGIKNLGFYGVVEAALGADVALFNEAHEFKEKGTLTTSCCPAFVMYIEKNFPELKEYISESVSPMVYAAMLIKDKDPNAKTVFIGPCTSKKVEYKLEKTEGLIDSVLSFEELQAFFDARDIEVTMQKETSLADASYFGRIFAKSSGIKEGIARVAKEYASVENIVPVSMSGIDECKAELTKLKFGKAAANFFEGMACDGGCLNGALCLHRGKKNLTEVDTFSKKAKPSDIKSSIELYKKTKRYKEKK